MKKLLAFFLVLMMAVSLVACGDTSKTETNDSEQTSSSKKEKGKDSDDDEKDDESSKSPVTEGNLTKAEVEDQIEKLFSEFDIKGFPVPDADSYEFTEETEGWFTATYEIKGVNLTYDEYKQQILDAGIGMKEGKPSLMGTSFGIPCGMEKLGFNVMLSEGTLSLFLTHYKSKYTKSYIAECEAKMPVIIPGVNALDLMPENFTAKFLVNSSDETILMKSGENWYTEIKAYDDDRNFKSLSREAIMMQDDGTMKEYSAYTSDLSKKVVWEKPSDYSYEKLEDKLETYFDPDGFHPSFSTYLQLCKDFEDGTANTNYFKTSLPSDIEKVGEETIGEIECDVLYYEGLWYYLELAIDPKTGVLYRYKQASGTNEDGTINWETNWDSNWTVTDFTSTADDSVFPQQ